MEVLPGSQSAKPSHVSTQLGCHLLGGSIPPGLLFGLGHPPHHGSPHPLTLRRTPARWTKAVTGHAEAMQMVSWTPHHCHLQVPAAWLGGRAQGHDTLERLSLTASCAVRPQGPVWRQTQGPSTRGHSSHTTGPGLTLRDLGRHHLSDLGGKLLQKLLCAHLRKGQVASCFPSHQGLP